MAPFFVLGLLAAAQSKDPFPFVIPWDDASATATDASFLNAMPAGKNGRIVAKAGHFVESGTGKRVRFFGTNLAGPPVLNGHADADKLVAHLAKFGINIVRIHHLQHNWDQTRMIWKPGKVYLELDPKQLDKLDYLIFALKRHGIYTNLNLQTAREYPASAGLPASIDQIPDYRKRVDKFYPKLIELQRSYAKDLLDRVNPYTHTRYAEEPALAIVEINNENSLVGSPWEGLGAGLSALPEPFVGELKRQWNAWLAKRYPGDEALRKAWSGGTPPGPSLTNAGSKWDFENHSNGDVESRVLEPEGSERVAPPIEVRIGSNPGPDWHVQASVRGLDLKEGATYTLSFKAKADHERPIGVSVALDKEDWRSVGLQSSAGLGTEWKRYRFVFTAQRVEPAHCRIQLVLGGANGKLWISDVSLAPGTPGGGLAPGESLAKGSVELGEGGSAAERADYVQFLADTERAFSDGMRAYLRDDLGIKAMIVDTQVAWGGLTGVYREQNMDFADNHAYWQHPEFPGKPWDSVNWRIGNTPMVNAMEPAYGEFGRLAAERVVGKPYSISEYNHPAPSDFQAEMMPMYCAMASVQDWDAIYTFDYGDTRDGGANDRIQGFFAVGTNPAKAAFFSSAAIAFRRELIPSARGLRSLQLPSKPWSRFASASEAWLKTGIPDLYAERVGVSTSTVNPQPDGPGCCLGGPWSAALQCRFRVRRFSGERRLVKGHGGSVFIADAPAAKMLAGFVGGGKFALGGVELAFASFGNGFAGVTLVAKDGKTLRHSGSALLTLVGRVENQGMEWNASRTSVGDRWGHGPTVAEGIPCKVRMSVDGPRKVWALDGGGRRVREVATAFRGGQCTFEVGPSERTVWYEVAK